MYIQTLDKTNLFNSLLGINQTVLENENNFIEIAV